MMADEYEPIRIGFNTDGTARTQVAFLVDCRSLSGASGSAVLSYRTQRRGIMMHLGPSERVFMGIDCAHVRFWTPVRESQDRGAPRVENMWVESNSDIAYVIPAWKILEVLNQDHLARILLHEGT